MNIVFTEKLFNFNWRRNKTSLKWPYFRCIAWIVHFYNKVLVVRTSTSKRILKSSVDYVEQREALCRLVYASARDRHCQALVCPSLGTPRRFWLLDDQPPPHFPHCFGWLLFQLCCLHFVLSQNPTTATKENFLHRAVSPSLLAFGSTKEESLASACRLVSAIYAQPSQQSRPYPFQV